MKKHLGKITAVILILALLFTLAPLAGADSAEPSRAINVVYDDSGSMIRSGDTYYDTWCQAKYSMEVFAGMLGSRDTMSIYVMSDFDNGAGTGAGPFVVLNGKDGASANVAKVHDMITSDGNTPFDAVRKAYSDLESAGADEKWLVILTDGAFEDVSVSAVNEFFAAKQPDVKVMFFAIGESTPNVEKNEAAGIFSEHAKNSGEILGKVTDISSRIFNCHRLEVNASSKKFSFDVPMSELVVFAQGADVSISGIRDADGSAVSGGSAPVGVRYSEKPTTRDLGAGADGKIKVDTNLVGSIVKYSGSFDSGEYSVDVNGADTIEVYYKPDVAIGLYLKDTEGREVTDLDKLEAGDFIIEFGFVKAGTGERLPDSALLGKVEYTATIENNGVLLDGTYTSGDRISLTEGNVRLSVVARFLEYNTVSGSLEYTVYKNRDVGFVLVDSPEFTVDSNGITGGPYKLKITLDGEDISAERWQEMDLPEVKAAKGSDSPIKDFRVEKGGETGVVDIYPVMGKGGPKGTAYDGDLDFEIEYREKHGDEVWAGASDGTIKISDGRSWLEKNLNKILFYGAIGLISLILIGYIPGVKKYLPKQLKGRPIIRCKPNSGIGKTNIAYGSISRKTLSSLLPYVPEKGRIKFVPVGVPGIAPMQVKAAGGAMVYVMNPGSYAGKRHIKFDGDMIEAGTRKPVKMSAFCTINVKTDTLTYSCTPTEHK